MKRNYVTVKAHLNTAPHDMAVLAKAQPVPAGAAAASEFVYMPAGENIIVATVGGKPEEITVIVDAATAERLQADLAVRLAGTVAPYFDYDHAGGRSSGRPRSFRWVEGRGVVCQVDWTTAARAAITDGEYSYFSPEFRYDRVSRTVKGLRDTGPLGGLVNDPAFRAIGAVQARHASNLFPPQLPADGPPQNPNPTSTMEKNIVAALIAAGILSQTEVASDGAPALVTARLAALKDGGDPAVKAAHASTLTAKDTRITELEAEVKAAKAATAKTQVDAAVKAGRIPAKDAESIKWWTDSLTAGGDAAVKALNALPASKAFDPTGAGSTEDAPSDAAAAQDAEYEAISARATAIARDKKLSFAASWTEAEAEVKARRAA
ncbi:MAG: phage protease [Verrucomicrobiota bacterium]